jgi:hypothetical protein
MLQELSIALDTENEINMYNTIEGLYLQTNYIRYIDYIYATSVRNSKSIGILGPEIYADQAVNRKTGVFGSFGHVTKLSQP